MTLSITAHRIMTLNGHSAWWQDIQHYDKHNDTHHNARTFNIMTLSISTLIKMTGQSGIMTHSKTSLTMKTLSIMTISIMTLSIKTPTIKTLRSTVNRHNNSQHTNTQYNFTQRNNTLYNDIQYNEWHSYTQHTLSLKWLGKTIKSISSVINLNVDMKSAIYAEWLN